MKAFATSQQALILLPILVVMALTIFFYRLTANTSAYNDAELPKIQGVILKESQQLADIQLTDHQGQVVNRDYFLGRWHFITYGYTHCPDICPTTLFTLTQLADLLNANHDTPDTQFVFYTVDPDRDSKEILTQYIHYFSEEFVAMRADTSINAENFQHSLGIKVEITRSYVNDDDKHTIKGERIGSAKEKLDIYQVSHGLTMFVLNPEAKLQAVFFPEKAELGIKGFTSDALYHDYLKVVKYYQQRRLL